MVWSAVLYSLDCLTVVLGTPSSSMLLFSRRGWIRWNGVFDVFCLGQETSRGVAKWATRMMKWDPRAQTITSFFQSFC